MPSLTRSRTLAVSLVALLALATAGLTACGDDDGEAGAGSSTTSASTIEAPEKLVIAYQAIPNGDLVVKHNGWLEEALPDTEIEWKLFDSGGSVNEAVLGGSVDIGLAGSSPVSRGISTGIPYQVPWIFDVIGEAEALVVKGDEGISGIEDLEGKRIATPFASTSHFSLLAALDDAGVDRSKVDIIDAEPDDIYAAWSRGDIDGAYVWNPNLAKMVDDGGKVLVSSADLAEQGTTTYDLGVVTDELAETYPDVVRTWVEQQNRAVELYRSDPDQVAEDVAAELNITPQEASDQLADLIFLTADEQVGPDYLGGGLATNLYDAATFNKELGEIPEVKPEQAYTDAVTATFAEQAGGG